MRSDVKPVEFDIDFTGVMKLKIEFDQVSNQSMIVDVGLYN